MHRQPVLAFTLIELLVVITIIVVLLALLVPALDKALEQANRAVCASHLKGIGNASVTYALQNKKQFIICRGRVIQNIFSPAGHQQFDAGADDARVDWLAALASVGLAGSTKVTVGSETWAGVGTVDAGATMPANPIGKIWDCPSRDFESHWDKQYAQAPIAYQYFGGIKTWSNPSGAFRSRSPVSLSTSSGGWALTADMTARAQRRWGYDNGYPQFYGDPVAHKASDGLRPAGGNNGYVDGSVTWYPFEDLVYIHFYTDQNNAEFFWKQSDLGDYDPPEAAQGRYIKD
jgi:type II secretory pathway pseudopilin PulG